MKILVIIPAYNESESILEVLAELKKEAPECDYLVVNDCSTDDTAKKLRENGCSFVNVPVNLGIGGGVQTGYKYAVENEYDVTVQLDGDGQHRPDYIKAIVAPVADGRLDMCVGSRFIEGSGFRSSFMRRVGINLLCFLLKITCGVKMTDATSGFRACSKELTAFFASHYAQDYPEPEAIMSAVLSGYKVGEAPVEMRERQGGSSSIKPLNSAYYMFKVSLAIILGRLSFSKKRR
ncbi:MAG: glycosyltransferase family 2 protein [Ruminococcaceae bacterium]|nr:glycosyltransferase family 2 protein [Oscillospiraceae bacterium]